MKYQETIMVDAKTAKQINHLLTTEPKDESECFDEDEYIVYTAEFDNRYFMDIKLCGVQYEEGNDNTPWCEAVLFDRLGCEVCCSEVMDEYFGEWELENDGNIYKVDVKSFTIEDVYRVLDEYVNLECELEGPRTVLKTLYDLGATPEVLEFMGFDKEDIADLEEK